MGMTNAWISNSLDCILCTLHCLFFFPPFHWKRTVCLCFHVHLQAPSSTSYIPSIIKKSLYWFYLTFIQRTTLLWWLGALSIHPDSICAHGLYNRGSHWSPWRPSHIGMDTQGGRVTETKSMSLLPPAPGNWHKVTEKGMSSSSPGVPLQTRGQGLQHMLCLHVILILFIVIQGIQTHA